MTATLVQAGVQLDYTPSADVTAGDIINLGVSLVGVAANDIAANQLGSLSTAGVYEIAKPTGAMIAGAVVDFDPDTSKLIATTTGGDDAFLIGRVVYAAASADATAFVLLNDRAA